MYMSFHVLLSVAMLLHITVANYKVYYVTPDDGDFINSNDTKSAKSLEYYLKNANKYLSSHSQFHFKMGYHYLNTDFVLQNATNVTLTGESLCIIRCTSHVGIIIFNVTNFRLENISFENCSTNYSNRFHTDFRYHSASINKFQPSSIASILLYYCMSVEINNITIITAEGNTGMLVVDTINYSKVTNVSINVQIMCTTKENSLQTNGILLYYDNWNIPNKTFSQIQLDNFRFITNGSCLHAIYHAITSLLFQNNRNVSVVIQNTIFNDLVNVTALYYYGEACGISVRNEITIRNCVVSDNIGDSSLKMFHITLYNMQCMRFLPSKLSHLQQYNRVLFTDCIFKNNFNMTSIIHISPASSQATTGYLYLERTTFHNNRNVHLLIMKSDTDSVWQLANYVSISKITVTSNIHHKGKDLMSVTNSWVWI